MNDKILISVIIPTYNREKTLERSISSVLCQTHNNLELIIVDDCSTDGTKSIVEKFHDSRIIYFKNDKNIGACQSRNKGIALANGKYIAFQDSDDFWYSNKLEKQVNTIIDRQVDIVYCKMRKIEAGGTSVFPKEKLNYDKSIFDQFLLHNKAGTQTLMFKKECFQDALFDPEMPRFQEWELMIRLSRFYKIFFIDEILVDYYIQEDSISRNYHKGLEAIKKLYNKFYVDIKRNKMIHSVYLNTISQYLLATNKNSVPILLKSLSVRFSFKTLFKFFIVLFGFSFLLRKRWENME